MREKILLEKTTPDERLGLGIAIESDDNRDWKQSIVGWNFSVLSIRVEQVAANSVAHRSGLRVGDRIWYIAGKDVHSCSRHKCLALFHQDATKIPLIVSRLKPQEVTILNVYKVSDSAVEVKIGQALNTATKNCEEGVNNCIKN
ncbi:unnamed protein product [Anisakis simplex]|uniref:PDZ domain-containing protein n=1 Tax=Anisakis simplex TaxID=6269 RepID=A0A0M3JVV8_ANISI|nr:unnamed protein product [Anisakis simplex]